MKISKEELTKLIREAVARQVATNQRSIKEAVASSIEKEILPGSGKLADLAGEVDKFLMDTADKARDLCAKMEEEMKVDMLGGDNPSLAPRVGERNRMLSTRIGTLKKLASNCVSIFEFIRREG